MCAHIPAHFPALFFKRPSSKSPPTINTLSAKLIFHSKGHLEAVSHMSVTTMSVLRPYKSFTCTLLWTHLFLDTDHQTVHQPAKQKSTYFARESSQQKGTWKMWIGLLSASTHQSKPEWLKGISFWKEFHFSVKKEPNNAGNVSLQGRKGRFSKITREKSTFNSQHWPTYLGPCTQQILRCLVDRQCSGGSVSPYVWGQDREQKELWFGLCHQLVLWTSEGHWISVKIPPSR